jgi:class 3 adenylate cyclase
VPIADDLKKWVDDTFRGDWEVQQTAGIPQAASLRLNSNHVKDLQQATVLYADLNGSTEMVMGKRWEFSAQIYKTYLRCAADIIRDCGGTITAYDGDRVMALFAGPNKDRSAAICGLKINWAVVNIIRPGIGKKWATDFVLSHVVGIDSSQLRAARIGVHGVNDLVWIGRAANYAAKLTAWRGRPTRITADVFNNLPADARLYNGQAIWVPEQWAERGILTYSSNWTWVL